MKYTEKQKRAIKQHWSDAYGDFRFAPDGTVLARRTPNSEWGVLYTAHAAAAHLSTIGLPLSH